MRLPFLLALGLCVLTSSASVKEIPLEQSVHVSQLSNGVRTYLDQRESSLRDGTFKVIVQTPSHQEVQFTYAGRLDDAQSLEQFFLICKGSKNAADVCSVSYSDSPYLGMEAPAEMAVIAVGHFDLLEMQELIRKHFDEVEFSEKKGAAPIQIGKDESISKVALNITFPNMRMPISTSDDLDSALKLLLLQELFQQRLERCAGGLEQIWVHPHPSFFYPVNGYAFVAEENSENLLSFLLWQVEAIRNEGFSEEEFFLAKRKMLNQLQYLAFNALEPSNDFLASYYADQFLLCGHCLSYQDFFDAAVEKVLAIQSEDLLPYIDPFFLDENRQVRVVYPATKNPELLTKEKIENMISRVAGLASFYHDSFFDDDDDLKVEINQASLKEDSFQFLTLKAEESPSFRLVNDDPNQSFYQLPLTDREKRFIKIIVTSMAEKNLVQLAFERRSMEKKGDKIHHVHPLRFMGYILGTPDLKHHLKAIKKSTFKWDALISGFSKRMREELSNDNVFQHLPGFANEIGSTPDHVASYIRKKDFEGLVKSML